MYIWFPIRGAMVADSASVAAWWSVRQGAAVTYELEERRIDVKDLRPGMFVCRLDRPWQGTPFPLQGIELHSEDDIRPLRELCRYVYIDARREVRVTAQASVLATGTRARTRFDRTCIYYDTVALEDEVPRAVAAYDNAAEIVSEIIEDISAGRGISSGSVDRAVRPVVESVMRSADAFFWIESQRSRNRYVYRHAIACSALAAAFGRHMGFTEQTIFSLAAGGLLLDVGKSRLDDTLLVQEAPLSPAQRAELRRHVDYGMRILVSSEIRDADVLDMVRSHHERHDGSGYPDGLAGGDIPLTARMAAIIDSYDAMISAVPYRAQLSRSEALSRIHAGRGSLYQAELVEQFQACLGVYPTGSLVELSSGEIAVVMAQNPSRRLRPRVAVLTDADKAPIDDIWSRDLMAQAEGAPAVEVRRTLRPGDHGLDPTEYFLA